MHKVKKYADILDSLRLGGNLRTIPEECVAEAVTDFSSNDYLGLAARPELQEEFFADPQRRRIPMTSSASRLLSARQREYDALERRLGELYGRPCLLMNSGYHANTGLIAALADSRTLIVADKLVHASIIDGIVLSKAPFERFRHNDLGHLERILAKAAGKYESVLIVAESVYSMDGDRADISGLAALRRRTPGAMLYIDEAHAVGAEGPGGLGLCRASECYTDADIIVGTFGKAFASMGAFCAVSPVVRDYLVNRSRSLIFSTALPPITAEWTRFLLEKILLMDSERDHLRQLGHRLRESLQPLSPDFPITPSHIQPLVLGSAEKAVSFSRRLLDAGLKVLPIRTPTVPPGTERLRISLSAAMTTADIDRLANEISRISAD